MPSIGSSGLGQLAIHRQRSSHDRSMNGTNYVSSGLEAPARRRGIKPTAIVVPLVR
jgi:hypothetical protein